MKHLTQHPLRKTLTTEDWQRIQRVLDRDLDDSHATIEEISAAHDVFYDAIAADAQTHTGSWTLQ